MWWFEGDSQFVFRDTGEVSCVRDRDDRGLLQQSSDVVASQIPAKCADNSVEGGESERRDNIG